MSTVAAPQGAARSRARHLYYRARLQRLLGRAPAASELCRRALEHCDYGRAYRLLAELELPGEDYLRVLERVHAYVRPQTYLEIGVARGDSLRLTPSETTALGIDPAPRPRHPLRANQRVVAETSDRFFATHDVRAELGGRSLRMAFIDGMHHFDFALRDFVNLEPYCERNSLIFVHDCYPLDERTAEREQSTTFWSGDVWRLIVLLKRHRPDLRIVTIGTPPTGLGLITHLDPTSSALRERLPGLIAEGLATDYASIAAVKPAALNLLPNEWPRVRALLDGR